MICNLMFLSRCLTVTTITDEDEARLNFRVHTSYSGVEIKSIGKVLCAEFNGEIIVSQIEKLELVFIIKMTYLS